MDDKPARRIPLALTIAAIVVVLDQATKFWADRTLSDRGPVPVLGDFLQLRLIRNAGAAFSMGEDSTWILTIITAAAVVLLLWYVTRPQPTWRVVGFALLLGGAITHLGDRLFRAPGFGRGHVVDFIDYNGWFVGNVADIALVGGAIWLVLLSLTKPEVRAGR
jgi:signal peptidase II